MIGAAFAGALIIWVFSGDQSALEHAYVGTPHLRAFFQGDGTTTPGDWLIGTLVEVALTFFLTIAVLTCMLEPERTRTGPLIAGLALTALVLAGYHLTGASVNPARWFGTAIWQRTVAPLETQPVFRDHLPYWMGPIVGALLAAVVYVEWLRPGKKG
jgi:glycerol uptake facilitator-like aquaporin